MTRQFLRYAAIALFFSTSAIAQASSTDEQQFIASLQLSATPHVRYLDANGRPLDYTAFAQMLQQRRSYSLTRDTHTGEAMLRVRPAGAHAGEAGRFAFGRGDAFPPFELHSLSGHMQRLGDFKGRYTLVSFFFAACEPCNAEAPTLAAYARVHHELNYLAITFDDAATAQRFVTRRGLDWPVLYDAQSLTDTLGVGIYPTLMLIDPDGHVAGAAVGMSMSEDPDQRLAELSGWIANWRRAGPNAR